MAILIALVIAGSGLVHVVYRHNELPAFCLKEHWGLRDTFVDGDGLIARIQASIAREIRLGRGGSISPAWKHEMELMTTLTRCGEAPKELRE